MSRKKRKKQSIIDTKYKWQIFIYLACFIVGFFGIMVYALLPQLSDFRNSIYGLIIRCAVVVGVISYLIFSKSIGQPLLGKITTATYAVLYVLFSIIDIGRIEALFFFIYSFVNITVAIYIYIKTGIKYDSIWLCGAFSYFSTAFLVLRVDYISGAFTPTFLIPSLIIMVIAFIACLIFVSSRYKKTKSLQDSISIPILGLMLGFIIPWLTISSMNVYLDFSSPTYVEYTIIDKDISTGARQVTTYELEVKNENSSFTIGVSEEAYYNYEINDKIVLSLYNGAFGEPYYIHDNK